MPLGKATAQLKTSRNQKRALAAALALGVVAFAGCAGRPDALGGSTGISKDSSPAKQSSSTSANPAQSKPATSTASAKSATSPIAPTATLSPKPTASNAAVVNCDYRRAGAPAKPVDPPAQNDVPATGTVAVTLDMSEGKVQITMDRAKAPCTVNSFQALAMQGFYNDTSCHRLVDQGIFILQCGDPTGTGRGGPGYEFADELSGNETYPAGTVAMANAGADTNGSQFFFVWADTKLNPAYTVFGKIDDASLSVITSIAARGISRDKSPNPISPAKIKTASVG